MLAVDRGGGLPVPRRQAKRRNGESGAPRRYAESANSVRPGFRTMKCTLRPGSMRTLSVRLQSAALSALGAATLASRLAVRCWRAWFFRFDSQFSSQISLFASPPTAHLSLQAYLITGLPQLLQLGVA
jgi:hypothetical protein